MRQLFVIMLSMLLCGCICPLVEYGELCNDHNTSTHVVNQYEIINLSTDTANVVLDCPSDTDRDLPYRDTLRYFFQNFDDDGIDIFCPIPFEKASYAAITLRGHKYEFRKDDNTVGNPLIISNYEIIRENSLHYIFRFYIKDENY